MAELEQWQVALALLLMLAGAPLSLALVERLRRQRHRRGASAFALALARQLGDPQIVHYAEQLGYAALVGDAHLTHAQRKFLLSAPDAADLIARYLHVQTLLFPSCEERRFVWRRARHEHRGYRSMVKIARLVCYIGSCMLACLPALTWVQLHGAQPMPAPLAGVQAGFCLVFLGLAIRSLRLGQRLARAELLAAGGVEARGVALDALYPLDQAYVHRRGAAND
jgi:hypothetical protein